VLCGNQISNYPRFAGAFELFQDIGGFGGPGERFGV
jgi:hypothetical protein